MPKPNDPNANEPNGNEPEGGTGTPEPTGGDGGKPEGNEPGALKDKHGEDAINLGHHNRLMAEKDAEIEKLTKQVEELTGKADKGADALKKIGELEARLADEKVSSALKLAGCVNEKAAKALLDDYEGDVSKLKEECPYLFGGNADQRQKGSTGAKHNGGAPEKDVDEMLDRAFGFKK